MILDSRWWSPHTNAFTEIIDVACIGVVAVENVDGWKCYIGFGYGVDQETDEEMIAKWGQPLGSKEAAVGFFPQLDPEGFRW